MKKVMIIIAVIGSHSYGGLKTILKFVSRRVAVEL